MPWRWCLHAWWRERGVFYLCKWWRTGTSRTGTVARGLVWYSSKQYWASLQTAWTQWHPLALLALVLVLVISSNADIWNGAIQGIDTSDSLRLHGTSILLVLVIHSIQHQSVLTLIPPLYLFSFLCREFFEDDWLCTLFVSFLPYHKVWSHSTALKLDKSWSMLDSEFLSILRFMRIVALSISNSIPWCHEFDDAGVWRMCGYPKRSIIIHFCLFHPRLTLQLR